MLLSVERELKEEYDAPLHCTSGPQLNLNLSSAISDI
jgi:hypothetical protein